MTKANNITQPVAQDLLKAPTGIKGLDEITGGGLPQGRTTLVCGAPVAASPAGHGVSRARGDAI